MDFLFRGNHWCVVGTRSFQPDVTSRSADTDLTYGGALGAVLVHASGEIYQCKIYQTVLDDASLSDIQKAQFEYIFCSEVNELTIGHLYRLNYFNR